VNARLQEAEHRAVLQQARDDPVGIALIAMCNVDLERVKSRLIDAGADEFLLLQGEARALRRLLKYLTERPITQPARFDKEAATNL
jgi:hypothetical protein